MHAHTTLLINNNDRGPTTVTEIDNYDSLGTNYAVTWFLPEHASHPFVGQSRDDYIAFRFSLAARASSPNQISMSHVYVCSVSYTAHVPCEIMRYTTTVTHDAVF